MPSIRRRERFRPASMPELTWLSRCSRLTCRTVTPGAGQAMIRTGVNVGYLVLFGVLLLGLGIAAVLVTRRRKDSRRPWPFE